MVQFIPHSKIDAPWSLGTKLAILIPVPYFEVGFEPRFLLVFIGFLSALGGRVFRWERTGFRLRRIGGTVTRAGRLAEGIVFGGTKWMARWATVRGVSRRRGVIRGRIGRSSIATRRISRGSLVIPSMVAHDESSYSLELSFVINRQSLWRETRIFDFE